MKPAAFRHRAHVGRLTEAEAVTGDSSDWLVAGREEVWHGKVTATSFRDCTVHIDYLLFIHSLFGLVEMEL